MSRRCRDQPPIALKGSLASSTAYIVLGLPEVDADTDLYFNTAVLIGPQRRRRQAPQVPSLHLRAEMGCIRRPRGMRCSIPRSAAIAMLICMDIHFFETARLQARWVVRT